MCPPSALLQEGILSSRRSIVSLSRAIQIARTLTPGRAPSASAIGSRGILLAASPPRTKSIAGTVPHHTSYLLLHTPQSPEKWPSIFVSRLFFLLRKKLQENGGLVNFCWHRDASVESTSRIDREEMHSATFWKMQQDGLAWRAKIAMISINNMEEILRGLFSNDHELEYEAVSGPYFYVCTHYQRDCRCGVRGSEFAESLRRELLARGMILDKTGSPRVGEVGHLGGHKNAPNVMVFPQGDWYGNLEPSDIPALLDHWLRPLRGTPPCEPPDGPNLLQWRGRMGMNKETQELAVTVSI